MVAALRENGGLRVCCELARQWIALGVPVTLLVLETVSADLPLYTPDPSITVHYASGRVRRFRWAVPVITWRVLRHVRAADVVVSGSEIGYELILGWSASRLMRRPFQVLVQAPLNFAVDLWQPARLQFLLRWLHRRVDHAMCVSPGVAATVVANGLPAQRVVAYPVGINVDDVRRDAIRAELEAVTGPTSLAALASAASAAAPGPVGAAGHVGPAAPAAPAAPAGSIGSVDPAGAAAPVAWAGGAPRVAAIGRLAAAKGFDLLLRAVADLRARGLHIQLVIIGEGSGRAGLEAQIADLGIADEVTLAGHVANPQGLLSTADLFVLSSRFEGNGGLVLLEALAHGVPVIATDCPTGPRDVLADGEFGQLVPCDDPVAIADAIAAFLADPAPLRGRAERGPDRARTFDQAACARLMIADLAAWAGGGGPVTPPYAPSRTAVS